MKLTNTLIQETIISPLIANTQSSAVQELLNCLLKKQFLTETTKLFSFIDDHDKLLNPAVGRGVAYHYSNSIEIKNPIAAFGISHDGINYNSPDGQKVHFIFLILDLSSDPTYHRKLITRFQHFINDIKNKSKILSSNSSEDIIETIKNWENDYLLNENI